MNKSFALLLAQCLAVFAISSVAFAQNLSDEALLLKWSEITKKLQADTILAASFEMESSDRFNNDNEQISGKLYLWKDGYRIETNQSKMLVYNGISTVLDATQRQAIISTYIAEDDDFAPAKLLQEDWLSTFNQTVDTKTRTIRWSTEDPFENFAEIGVTLDDYAPNSLIAIDQLQNKVSLYMSMQKWMPTSAAESQALFSIEIPKEYELIDLRDEQ
jgi:hypothetical protein